jgi:hypothetical protein
LFFNYQSIPYCFSQCVIYAIANTAFAIFAYRRKIGVPKEFDFNWFLIYFRIESSNGQVKKINQLNMNEFLNLFANSINHLNQEIPGFVSGGRQFLPGIGPYSENKIVELAVNHLLEENLIEGAYIRPNNNVRQQLNLSHYFGLNGRDATPDLVYGSNLIEFKLCRPLGDNGQREDTWFKKVFEPNPQSYSSFLDVIKLYNFHANFNHNNYWNRWIIVIGFERHIETEYPLDLYFPNMFNFVSTAIVNVPIAEFISVSNKLGTRHPYHQVLKLYAFKY